MAAIDSFSLVSVPLFLLMGNLMTEGGLTYRLMALANVIVGRFRGGLAMANVLAVHLHRQRAEVLAESASWLCEAARQVSDRARQEAPSRAKGN